MNWTTAKVRETFLKFFKDKGHTVVPSAPMVLKNDPTLMFTNAGMNQFKDVFLGNEKPVSGRVVDTQKCLRVSGKHNDLEEVGVDTYHHTMFEMLGNWSFGDFFKAEAVQWAWELLTDVYGLDKDRLYVSVFAGDEEDNTPLDIDAQNEWKKWVSEERILAFGKGDNFWEMGDVGPCGPCSEIHFDMRSDEERVLVDGKTLVNMDHPQVIEIWNLVFIEFSRNQKGELSNLPNQHVDTGMGLERITRALQGKQSNYDIDLFVELIEKLEAISSKKYSYSDEIQDIAFRVAADHVRAVAFAIADGQLPSNGGAGYVIRRILRRAVRYGYSYLSIDKPFLHQLVPVLVSQFGNVFEGVKEQEGFIAKVILEEETSFLRTLEKGLKRLDQVIESSTSKELSGEVTFELYDTYGFPFDLTQLICQEKGVKVSEEAFALELQKQKDRSRSAGKLETGDWVVLSDENNSTEFVGYDEQEVSTEVLRFREVLVGKKKRGQIVLRKTPFYPQGGGQVGDAGQLIWNNGDSVDVINTVKENDTIMHIVEELPSIAETSVVAKVNGARQKAAAQNHSATHLLHHALREVLGEHVAQKGSLVHPDYLRFDFSHFEKVTQDELDLIEQKVLVAIRKNISLNEFRAIPIDEAKAQGAMSLFGEKYGETVRMIQFGQSKELCGGIHVTQTADIGDFVIVSESSVAAGTRRIEAVTAEKADALLREKRSKLDAVSELLNNPKDLLKGIADVLAENKSLRKEAEAFEALQNQQEKHRLGGLIKNENGINVLITETTMSPKAVKTVLFQLKQEYDMLFAVLGTTHGNKPNISVLLTQDLIDARNLHAVEIVKTLAKEIQGGGGGQPFFASAGGKNSEGVPAALKIAEGMI